MDRSDGSSRRRDSEDDDDDDGAMGERYDREKAIQELVDFRAILLSAGIGASMTDDPPLPPAVPPLNSEPGHALNSDSSQMPLAEAVLPKDEHRDESRMPRNSIMTESESDLRSILGFDAGLPTKGLEGGVLQGGWHKIDNLLVNADFVRVIDSSEL